MHFTMTLDSSKSVLPRTGFKICYQRAQTTGSNSQNRDDKLRCFFLAPLCFVQDFLQKVNLCRHQMAALRRWFWCVHVEPHAKSRCVLANMNMSQVKRVLGPVNVCKMCVLPRTVCNNSIMDKISNVFCVLFCSSLFWQGPCTNI